MQAALGILYYLSGMEQECFDQLSQLSPSQVQILSEEQQANYYLIMAYMSGALNRNFDSAMEFADSLLALHEKSDPSNKALNYLDLNNLIEIYILHGDTAQAWSLIRQMESNQVDDPKGKYQHQMNVNKARLYYQSNQLDSARKYSYAILNGPLLESDDAYNRLLAYEIQMTCDSL